LANDEQISVNISDDAYCMILQNNLTKLDRQTDIDLGLSGCMQSSSFCAMRGKNWGRQANWQWQVTGQHFTGHSRHWNGLLNI